ncbi:MAG TPA: protoporphyrinogen oxidase [Gemmatimonadota bacterium]|nr:protoporphyrinogen oxidase [Gemmatimonadota bacterium]
MICIVGAGVTGLALARELAERDVEHVVLEAADRPGGVIRSANVEGRVLDFGPQRLRLSGALATLVRELGLESEIVRAPEGLPLYVYAGGALREVPFSLRALATGDALTWRGKLRLAREPLTAGPRPGERVAGFFTRKLGREAYERLAGPLFGGLYASDPADMPVDLSLSGVLRDLGVRRSLLTRFARRTGVPAAACTFRNGVQALTDALHAAGAGSVRLGNAARRLERAGSAWMVECARDVIEARVVVLACDAPAAAKLLAGPAPDAARRLAALAYNPLAVVHLEAGETGLSGLGYQVAFGENLATRGVTWNDSLFGGEIHAGRRGQYTAFLGGARMPSVVSEPDGRVGAIAAREFETVTGRPARVLSVSRTSMPAWDVTWGEVAQLSLPAGILAAGSWRSRPGVPGRLAEAAQIAYYLTSAG